MIEVYQSRTKIRLRKQDFQVGSVQLNVVGDAQDANFLLAMRNADNKRLLYDGQQYSQGRTDLYVKLIERIGGAHIMADC